MANFLLKSAYNGRIWPQIGPLHATIGLFGGQFGHFVGGKCTIFAKNHHYRLAMFGVVVWLHLVSLLGQSEIVNGLFFAENQAKMAIFAPNLTILGEIRVSLELRLGEKCIFFGEICQFRVQTAWDGSC